MKIKPFLIFLLPAAVSLPFAIFVLDIILENPDRSINMMQFNANNDAIQNNNDIRIINLQNEYSLSSHIKINVMINNDIFDCGDLFVNVYDLNHDQKQLFMQTGYFNQCFTQSTNMIPISDSIIIEQLPQSGTYEIVIEMHDKTYKKTIIARNTFAIK